MRTIGLDLGTRKLAWSLLESGVCIDVGWLAVDLRTPRSVQLHRLANYVCNLVLKNEADLLVIEKAIVGNNRKYSMAISELSGAIQATCVGYVPKIEVVDNKTWKKLLLKNGNSSKSMVSMWLQHVYPDYAAQCDDDQDRIDAVCIALAGEQIVQSRGL